LGVALLIALLPVVRMWSVNLVGSLQSGARGASAGGRTRAMGGVLVTLQVALALMLLVGACLLIRSFARVMAIDPGFQVATTMTGRVALNASYKDGAAMQSVQDRIIAGMREIPGVEAAAVTGSFPLYKQFPVGNLPLRGAAVGPTETLPNAYGIQVTPEYFDVMGIRILEGRGFTAADRLPRARPVFIVDRNFEEKYFPGRSAIGETLAGPANQKPEQAPIIIGVAAPAKLSGMEDVSGIPFVYQPLGIAGAFSVVVRSHRSLAELTPLMRQKVRTVDPTLPLYGVTTLQTFLHSMLANRRGVMLLLAAFAAIALLLAAVGIYGMLAYDVTQRTREIGIRGAIGASRGQIMTLILRQGLGKTALGLVIGLAGAFALSRYMGSLLFEVRPSDPVAFGAVSVLLLLVALLASWLPARRAAKVDPIVALRTE
jgi:predicted permease